MSSFILMSGLFQLTPSRRATTFERQYNINETISTHALTEGDEGKLDGYNNAKIFQLTPSRRATNYDASHAACNAFQLTPSRRATFEIWSLRPRSLISTHALTEGDHIFRLIARIAQYFNSRPHGGRLFNEMYEKFWERFQLTPSRRATANLDKFFF